MPSHTTVAVSRLFTTQIRAMVSGRIEGWRYWSCRSARHSRIQRGPYARTITHSNRFPRKTATAQAAGGASFSLGRPSPSTFHDTSKSGALSRFALLVFGYRSRG